jgi:hypothetical protein
VLEGAASKLNKTDGVLGAIGGLDSFLRRRNRLLLVAALAVAVVIVLLLVWNPAQGALPYAQPATTAAIHVVPSLPPQEVLAVG